MRVLFITAFPPGNRPGSGAGEQISYVRLKYLRQQYEHIDVAVVSHVPVPSRRLARELGCTVVAIPTPIWEVIKEQGVGTLIYGQFASRDTHSARARIAELLMQNSYDAAFFDFSQTFCFLDEVSTVGKRICYVHDVIVQRNSRALSLYRLFLRRQREMEGDLLRRFSDVIVLSAKDQQLLEQEYGIHSRVDAWEEFLFKNQKHLQIERAGQTSGGEIVCFGNFKRLDNWLPLLILLGFSTMKSLMLWRLPERPVYVVGFAPEWLRFLGYCAPRFMKTSGFLNDPTEVLGQAAIFVAPLISGAGVKIKVKEYQRFDIPILGTSIAFEGIGARQIDMELPFWDCARIIRHLSYMPVDIFVQVLTIFRSPGQRDKLLTSQLNRPHLGSSRSG